MFGLTESLQNAQRSRSPRYGVSVTAAPRSAGGLVGGGAWVAVEAMAQGLATWNSQSIAHDAAANELGVLRLFLSHFEGTLACQWCSGDEGNPATWVDSSVTQITTFTPAVGVHTPKPALVYAEGVWHAFYLLPNGNIFHRSSADNGATWSSASALYAGGDAISDLFALYLPIDELLVVQFSTSSDAIRPRGAAGSPGDGWEVWSAHDDARGWLPAGMVALGDDSVRQFYVAQSPNPVQHFMGTLDCTVAGDGALVERSEEASLLHYVAGASPIRPTLHAVGSGFGGVWMTQQARGATRTYLCGGAVLRNQASALSLPVEPKPIHVQPLAATPLERHNIALDRGDRTLLIGLGKVYRSQHETAVVSDEQIVAYRYSVMRNGAGKVVLYLRRGSPLAATRPGDGLWLTRTCSKGEESGSVTLGFEVVRVDAGSDRVVIEAVDALGVLAGVRALHPKHVGAGLFARQGAAELICGWAGLGAEVELVDEDEDGAAWHWRAGESGLAALTRFLALDAVQLRSRVEQVGTLPYVCIAAHEGAEPYLYGDERHPIVKFARRFDRSDGTLIAVRGLAIRNSPADGEDWALEVANEEALSPGRRPSVLALEDRSLVSSELALAAEALAQRAQGGSGRATLSAQANLALEVDDIIEANGKSWRVEALIETWDRGRCLQHVELVEE